MLICYLGYERPKQQVYQPSYQEGQGSTTGGPNPVHGGTIKATGESKPDLRGFQICNSRHFKPGHVFKVLWSEPMGQTTSGQTDATQDEVEDTTGENVYTTIRRFIIVASGKGLSSCV